MPYLNSTAAACTTSSGRLPDVVAELPAWLAAREAAVEGLRPHCATQLRLVGESKGRNPDGDDVLLGQTDVAVLYLHGFSASPEEIQPLPTQLADALNANLYIPRLTGHGLDGAALAAARPEDWITDVDEAFEIAKMLGRKVIVLGTSTGATLAFRLALNASSNSEGDDQLAALLLISPNFASRDPRGEWLRRWWGRILFRITRGSLHGIEPLNKQHGRFWTTYFPVRAVANLLNLVAGLRKADFAKITVPCLVAYSPGDQVVDVRPVERKFAELGSRIKTLIPISDSDDPLQHVIAGDIRSPATTMRLKDEMLKFLDSAGVSQRL